MCLGEVEVGTKNRQLVGILGRQPIKKVSSPEIEFLETYSRACREEKSVNDGGTDGPPVGLLATGQAFPLKSL